MSINVIDKLARKDDVAGEARKPICDIEQVEGLRDALTNPANPPGNTGVKNIVDGPRGGIQAVGGAQAEAEYTQALGWQTRAGGFSSTAVGVASDAYGTGSLAMGLHGQALIPGSLAIGGGLLGNDPGAPAKGFSQVLFAMSAMLSYETPHKTRTSQFFCFSGGRNGAYYQTSDYEIALRPKQAAYFDISFVVKGEYDSDGNAGVMLAKCNVLIDFDNDTVLLNGQEMSDYSGDFLLPVYRTNADSFKPRIRLTHTTQGGFAIDLTDIGIVRKSEWYAVATFSGAVINGPNFDITSSNF